METFEKTTSPLKSTNDTPLAVELQTETLASCLMYNQDKSEPLQRRIEEVPPAVIVPVQFCSESMELSQTFPFTRFEFTAVTFELLIDST